MINGKLKSEIVEGSIEVLEARGWCQFRAYRSDGRVCAGEAMVQSITGQSTTTTDVYGDWASRLGAEYSAFISLQYEIIDVLGIKVPEKWSVGGDYSMSVAGWNDLPTTSYEIVRDRLTDAAKHFRDRGE